MFNVYSPQLELLGAVEIPTSDNHSIYWQETGNLRLISLATERNVELLKNDRFIFIQDDARQGGINEAIYVIVNVSLDEEKNELTVNGKTANYLLHQRACIDQVITDTTAATALAALISANLRGLPIEIAANQAGDPTVIRYPLDGGTLDRMSQELMEYCGIGQRVEFDVGKIRLTLNTGQDSSTAVDVPVLGRQSGRARSPILTIDTSDYANVAIGTLVFKSGAEEPYIFGETGTTAADRREYYTGEIMQEAGESDEEFLSRAEELAMGMLSDHLLRTTITADISPSDYGHPYRVGDIIRARIGSVEVVKRITCATWLHDQNNDKVSLTLGDQLNTVIAEILEKTTTSSSGGGGGGVASNVKDQEQKIAGILTDFKSLYAQVDGLAAGMDAYVLTKTFEDYKYAVTRLFAAMDDQVTAQLALKVSTEDLKAELQNYALAESLGDYLTIKTAAELYTTDEDVQSIIGAYIVTDLDGNQWSLVDIASQLHETQAGLQLKADEKKVEAQGDDIAKLQEAQTTLYSRLESAESSLTLKAEASTVTALSGRVTTVEEAQSSLSARVGSAEASLKLKADSTTVTDLSGRVTTVEQSTATLQADVIELQGNVEILGNLSIDSGRLKVAKSIYTDNAVFARTFYSNDSEIHVGNNTVNITTPVSFASGGMSFGGNTYTPTTITSTAGDVTVLGY